MIKQQLFEKIRTLLDQRIAEANQAIVSAKESRDNETKSSVGDKYETGRTLMQQEVEKNRVLLRKTEKFKNELNKINLIRSHEKVEFGSLVRTDQNNYFIISALGKMDVANETFFCISLASPIGKALHNKKAGETFLFQGKNITITNIS